MYFHYLEHDLSKHEVLELRMVRTRGFGAIFRQEGSSIKQWRKSFLTEVDAVAGDLYY